MAILKQCNIENEVDLEVEKEKIVVKPVKTKPREGWNDAFRLMHEKKDDALLLDETIDFDNGKLGMEIIKEMLVD